MAGSSNTVWLLGGLGALAYFTRASWLPTAEADFPSLFSGATGNNALAPTTTTANQPVTAAIPGAVALGNQGCYQYPTGTSGSLVTNCPPGVSPPATTQQNNCADGFTLDAAGICTRYPDAVLLAQLNTIPWTGFSDVPNEQIMRIDPQILAMYSTVTGVTAGSVLAYMLGLGSNPVDGAIMNGSDGNAYQALSGIFYRQGTSTLTTMRAGGATVAAIGNRGYVNGAAKPTSSGRIGTIAADLSGALPVTSATLIQASCDPSIAALTGRNPRAMLTASQWNALYTRCTGIVQGIPLHDPAMIGSVMSAEQYHARRQAAGLQTISNLGTLRPARRGAFPLGRVGLINQWLPPGNRTIYQMPGRGAVPAGRGGLIPPPLRRMGLIHDGGGDHRSARSPFPRPSWWREAE